MPQDHQRYSANFYAGQSDGSAAAALALLPTVLDLVRPSSVIDIGCGTGAWLATCRHLGVGRTVGLEGGWVRQADLRDQAITLVTTDLERPLTVSDRFDLAISLEVAEHLSAGRAEALVEEISRLAPVVLFGAAIPGQGGGFNHINEQWQSYWVAHFARRDYQAIDLIRPRFWTAHEIPVHYRQNTMLYVHSSVAGRYREAAEAVASGFPIDVVHPEVHVATTTALNAPPTISQSLRAVAGLPGAVVRSLSARLARRDSSRPGTV